MEPLVFETAVDPAIETSTQTLDRHKLHAAFQSPNTTPCGSAA